MIIEADGAYLKEGHAPVRALLRIAHGRVLGRAARWLRTSAAIAGEFTHGVEGFGADVVFDAFGVDFGGAVGDAECNQEIHDLLVASAAAICEGLALGGQENRPIRFILDQFLVAQAADGLGDGDVGNAKPLGHVHAAGLAALSDQVVDQFDVIFLGFGGVMAAGGAKGRGAEGFLLRGHPGGRGLAFSGLA